MIDTILTGVFMAELNHCWHVPALQMPVKSSIKIANGPATSNKWYLVSITRH
ncbi:MAG: hypothetical protein HGB04_00670 [Chlorobiaceae bacterium]|nr:hypothetical protein [Chlorobiaceae bacterium]